MDFGILGPLVALDGARDVAPRRVKARALLALLLLHANERVATDRILEALWGEDPPATADKALQGHVSALRKLLGSSRIRTEGGSYRLVVEAGELDRDRFMAAMETARGTVDPRERSRHLADALALWRGDPLADLAAERFAGPDIAHLDELRLAAQEERAEAELELGRHAELVPELTSLVERHPMTEGLRARLMLALYRSGRQSEALRVYRDGRRLLADELGIDPGSELRLLERRILDQDPALTPPRAAEPRPAPPRQERKTVTVLVAEVAAASGLDPEDLERSVGPLLASVRAAIERHGGTAEPLFANGFLGVFGAPLAHDDDPIRAVRAALELRDSRGAASTRVGIETGPALVTVDGGRVAVTGEVLGEASRLQVMARVGSVIVGEATRRLSEARVEYEPVGPGTWAPRGLRRREPGPLPGSPFIGRTQELSLLERLAARAREERSVQLVTIVAEPGGGKTRLLQELRSDLAASTPSPVWLQGSCLPYGDGVTYWALGEIVKAWAGILESDESEASAAKIAAVAADLEPDAGRRPWLERGLRALIGIEHSPSSADREQAFAPWRQFLEALAGRAPTIVAFEDIHWADEAFLGFLDHLVSRASGVPLMVVCTARLDLLEAHPGWAGGKRNATTIALEPLSQSETQDLLRGLLGRQPEPETVRRAGGNPLFAHELASIVGAGSSGESIAVPESLQAVIAAHLDALPPELKALAADAAVVGEVFWPGAVASMAGEDEAEVESRLLRLVAHDVARRRRPSSVARQSEYAFLHVLVRDVAYGQIPRRDRIAKHRAAGAWIEQLAGDRVTNYAELIAHHYVEALDIARGLDDEVTADELRPRAAAFLALAGEGARTVEITRAEGFFRRALEMTPPDDPAHGRLLARLAEVADLTGRLPEAERLGEQAIAELRAHGNMFDAGEAMGVLVATKWRLGRPDAERRRLAREAVHALEGMGPSPALVKAYSRMATHELHAARARECDAWSRRALAVARALGSRTLELQPLHLLGILRFESGDQAGIDDIREAVRIGLEAGLSWETATAQSNLAATIWVSDGPAAALEIKLATAEFAASRGLGALERTIRAESLWQLHDAGRWDDAIDLADDLIATEGDGAPSRVTTMARTVRGRILADRGRTKEASDLETDVLPRARELGDPQDLGPALAAAAALRQAVGDLDGAAEFVAELERVTRGRDRSQRIHELPHAARVCLAAGTTAVAEALIAKRGLPAYTRARLCIASARAIFAEARGQLATAAQRHAVAAEGWRAFGNPAEEAHALLGQARCLIGLGRAKDARPPLRVAGDLGRALGAVLVVGEAERLLGPGQPGRGPLAAVPT
jgi:DNA-binding SARP family transcriptional activator